MFSFWSGRAVADVSGGRVEALQALTLLREQPINFAPAPFVPVQDREQVLRDPAVRIFPVELQDSAAQILHSLKIRSLADFYRVQGLSSDPQKWYSSLILSLASNLRIGGKNERERWKNQVSHWTVLYLSRQGLVPVMTRTQIQQWLAGESPLIYLESVPGAILLNRPVARSLFVGELDSPPVLPRWPVTLIDLFSQRPEIQSLDSSLRGDWPRLVDAYIAPAFHPLAILSGQSGTKSPGAAAIRRDLLIRYLGLDLDHIVDPGRAADLFFEFKSRGHTKRVIDLLALLARYKERGRLRSGPLYQNTVRDLAIEARDAFQFPDRFHPYAITFWQGILAPVWGLGFDAWPEVESIARLQEKVDGVQSHCAYMFARKDQTFNPNENSAHLREEYRRSRSQH